MGYLGDQQIILYYIILYFILFYFLFYYILYIHIPNISQSKDDNGLNRNGIYHYDMGRKSYYEKTESGIYGIIMGYNDDKA